MSGAILKPLEAESYKVACILWLSPVGFHFTSSTFYTFIAGSSPIAGLGMLALNIYLTYMIQYCIFLICKKEKKCTGSCLHHASWL